MSSNPAETSPLKSLLSKLWDVGQRKLEQFQPRNNGEAMQADLATRLLPEWRRITDNLAVDPSSLDYISPSVTLPTTSVKLPPEAPAIRKIAWNYLYIRPGLLPF